MYIQSFLFNLVLLAIVVASCIAVYKYKGFPLVLSIAACFLYFTFIEQMGIFSLIWWYPNQNRYFLFHIGNIGESIILLLMYREIFKKYVKKTEKYVYRKIFVILIATFVLFAIANAIWWQPLDVYPSYTRVALSVMIVTLNILYTYKYTVYEPIPRTGLELVNYQTSKISFFWIATGLLLFHSFSLFRYMFADTFRDELSKEAHTNVLNVQAVFAIVLYAFIAIGFIKAKRIVIVDEHGNKLTPKQLRDFKNNPKGDL